jgi:hypothetical protein
MLEALNPRSEQAADDKKGDQDGRRVSLEKCFSARAVENGERLTRGFYLSSGHGSSYWLTFVT